VRRLTAPARPLHDQLADLEALLGHAVVLEDPQMFELWRVPESCAACVCLPVSTATTPLGTIWFFADEARTFSDRDTGTLELAAGRIASDLERTTMLAEAALRRRRQKQESQEAAEFSARAPSPADKLNGND
jgi:GAF domain-containing protein